LTQNAEAFLPFKSRKADSGVRDSWTEQLCNQMDGWDFLGFGWLVG